MGKRAGKTGVRQVLLRQWAVLCAVPREPHMKSTADIWRALKAEGFDVTKRTVERDLGSLEAAFALLRDDSQNPHLWSWSKEARPLLAPTFTPAEALAFELARRHLEPLFPASMLKMLAPHFALAGKTLRELGGTSRASSWANKVRVVPPTQMLVPPKLNHEVYGAITDALLQERQLKVAYGRRKAPETKDLVLHPLGLVQRGAVIYLVATAFDYPDVRLYAIHRFARAAMLDDPMVRRDFDLDDYIAKGNLGFGRGTQIRFEAIFTADIAAHLGETPLAEDQVAETLLDKRVRITATVAETPQLKWWLLGFGSDVTVVRPESLRAEIAKVASAMAANYSGSRA
jgi:predicted DNA-binding transcriptional regulator YafY